MAGIGRIEQSIKSKLESTDKNISLAFQDLNQLITMAQQMTRLSKSIASKITEVNPSETTLFRSYLLQLGIDQQVDLSSTDKGSTSSTKYEELARQLASIVKPVMQRNKQDQLTLSDTYCCFNRARGMDLVSPDDIILACKAMQKMPELQLKLVQYKSGLMVIQNMTCDSEDILTQTIRLVEDAIHLTPLQMSAQLKVPVQLARQRLEEAEMAGKLCRDESLEGLNFYINKFVPTQ